MRLITKAAISILAASAAIAVGRLIQHSWGARRNEEKLLQDAHEALIPELRKTIKYHDEKLATAVDRDPTPGEFALIEAAKAAGWPATGKDMWFGTDDDGKAMIVVKTGHRPVRLQQSADGASFFITSIGGNAVPEGLRGLNLPFETFVKAYA